MPFEDKRCKFRVSSVHTIVLTYTSKEHLHMSFITESSSTSISQYYTKPYVPLGVEKE